MKMRLVLAMSILILMACQAANNKMMPTYNKGGYMINMLNDGNSSLNDSIIIKGYVRDYATKTNLDHSVISIGCIKVLTNESGFFYLKYKSISNKTSITAVSIGYRTVETAPLDLVKGTVTIDFLLALDDRPLLNCEGQ